MAIIKKVQFVGDMAIVIIDKALVEQLALDNNTYLREEITQDGDIVLHIEPLTAYTRPRCERNMKFEFCSGDPL